MKILLVTIIIIFLIIILLIKSKIKIHISNLKIKYFDKKIKINDNFQVILSLTFFNKIVYYKKIITKNRIKKEQINKIQKRIKKNKKQNTNRIKKINKKLKLEKLRMQIDLGIEDASLTAMSVGISSIIISTLVKYMAESSKEIKWNIRPIYNDTNYFNIDLDCTFSAPLIWKI